MSGNKRIANRYGQMYLFEKEEITSLKQLCPGDHIAEERFRLYWHHMIVEKVDQNAEIIQVIHYYNTAKEFFETFPYKAKVRRDTFPFTPGKFFLIHYGRSNPASKVLEKAQARLGEEKYNTMLNNCEHFCSMCKINVATSQQVHIFTDVLLGNLYTVFSELFCLAAKKSAVALSRVAILRMTAGVAALSVLFGVVIATVDIYEVFENYEAKIISFDQFKTLSTMIIIGSLSSNALSVAGFFIGQAVIPVPFVGGIMGGFLGLLSGKLIAVVSTWFVRVLWACTKGKLKVFFRRLASKIRVSICKKLRKGFYADKNVAEFSHVCYV